MMEKFAASSRAPAEWQSNTAMNMQAALRAQKLADEQFDMSKMSHDATRNDNINQYQNVHVNFQRKLDATSQLSKLLQERIQSIGTSIHLSKQSLGALQTTHQSMMSPLQLCSWRQEQRAA